VAYGGVVRIIMKLVDEYRSSLRSINKLLLISEMELDTLDDRDPDYPDKFTELIQRRSRLRYYIGNLMYAIQWMETGREPGKIGGADNRSAADNY
jgi:hypothetical protein